MRAAESPKWTPQRPRILGITPPVPRKGPFGALPGSPRRDSSEPPAPRKDPFGVLPWARRPFRVPFGVRPDRWRSPRGIKPRATSKYYIDSNRELRNLGNYFSRRIKSAELFGNFPELFWKNVFPGRGRNEFGRAPTRTRIWLHSGTRPRCVSFRRAR